VLELIREFAPSALAFLMVFLPFMLVVARLKPPDDDVEYEKWTLQYMRYWI